MNEAFIVTPRPFDEGTQAIQEPSSLSNFTTFSDGEGVSGRCAADIIRPLLALRR